MRSNKTVFLGSTFKDLEYHRRALVDALHDLAWLRIMESRGAAAGSPIDNCLRWVRSADVYVGAYGMCYGSREPNSGVSYTELEYDEAKRLELPCLVYLIDEDRHPLLPSSIDRGEDAEDLTRFKTKVCDSNHRGLFRSPEHLQYQVVRDIINLYDDQGWWTSTSEGREPAGDDPEQAGWKVQLCAWGSSQGLLDLSRLRDDMKGDEFDVAASFLVSRFSRGEFADLKGFVTLRPEIRNALRSFLAVRDIDESKLADSILDAHDALSARLLVDVAGLAGAKSCAEPICRQLISRGRQWDGDIRAHGYEMRSFLDVCGEALGRMPRSCVPVVTEFKERARQGKAWHAKKTLEKALRRMTGDPGESD